MLNKNYLQALLAGESRAYGFTIAFWGSGALLIKANGLPVIGEALLYGLGAVVGFGVLAAAAFGEASREVEYDNPSYLVLGMVHYLAALVPMLVAHAITTASVPATADFFLSGFAVSTTYNLLAVLEEDVTEVIGRFTPV
ncbi:MAG: hypothetical protein ABEK16_02790 [Candidatus Nanohalobium sp.]